MKHAIRPAARDDILRQYRYYLVAEAAPAVAQRFLKAVRETINHVCRLPRIGPITVLENPKLAGLRSWPVRGFEAIRIYYLPGKGGIRVIRVLHGKRDVNPILEQDSSEEGA